MRKLFLLLTLLLMMNGCAKQGISTMNHFPASDNHIVNQITVNKPYSAVWDGLVKELAKSFYVINNIDKESRLINVSFSTDKAVEYVDCGKTKRTYTVDDNVEVFEYETAGNAVFKMAANRQINNYMAGFYSIRRTTNLEGRSNIYVAPSDENPEKTTISVNTRYILSVKATPTLYGQQGNREPVFIRHDPPITSMHTFNLNRPETIIWDGKFSGKCVSKGTLEYAILEMVKKN